MGDESRESGVEVGKRIVIDTKKYYQELIPSLRGTGDGKAWGLCPFHENEKPSLCIDFKVGTFFCHSCNVSGKLHDFLFKIKKKYPARAMEVDRIFGEILIC